MGRTPNYRFDRMQRDRAKAAKNAEKAAIKEAAKKEKPAADSEPAPAADKE
jgi:hypothetical protein